MLCLPLKTIDITLLNLCLSPLSFTTHPIFVTSLAPAIHFYPSLHHSITLHPSRKRSDVDLVKSMDSTVVSNSPVDHLFCVVEDVSLRCVVCIIDTLDIQLMSARVDIRSTTNTGKPFYLLPWVENAQKFVTEISKWTNSKRFETLIKKKI